MDVVAGRAHCVVFMPMLAGFESIRGSVALGVHASGMVMIRLEEALADADWQRWLIRAVPQASIVLADVTDHNPFVMYELGLAHARRIPTLLVVDSRNDRVSATVLGTPFIPYDVGDLEAFEGELTCAIEELTTGLTITPNLADSYACALALAGAFATATGLPVETVSFNDFTTRLDVATNRGDLCPAGAQKDLYFLARVIQNADDVRLMRSLRDWSACAAAPPRARTH